MPKDGWPDGPIVLGVSWGFPELLVRRAADFAADLGLHLVCAFVDPASYLTEWEAEELRTAHSMDPAVNEEADFPAGQLLLSLEAILGLPGEGWSFRVLNGDIAPALGRLAESAGASMFIVGCRRSGVIAWLDRLIEGPVYAALLRQQRLPVLIIPYDD